MVAWRLPPLRSVSIVNMSSVGANSLLAFTKHYHNTKQSPPHSTASLYVMSSSGLSDLFFGFPLPRGMIDSNACHDSNGPIRLAPRGRGGANSPPATVLLLHGGFVH